MSQENRHKKQCDEMINKILKNREYENDLANSADERGRAALLYMACVIEFDQIA